MCAGRTGRANSTGISVVLVDRKKEGLIPFIERKAGLKFERIGAPQPQDMARIAGERAVTAIRVRTVPLLHFQPEAPAHVRAAQTRTCPLSAECSTAFTLQEVDSGVVPWFTEMAGALLADMPAEEALARALAKITGHSAMQARARNSVVVC